jgi:Tol biopolymer transport system component
VSMAGGATQHHTSLSFVDRHGNATAIPFPPALFQSAAVSPDGRAVAIGLDNANASIWMGDLVRATATRLTLAWSNNDAVWSPDGKRVVFTSGRGGARNVFWQAVENNEPEQLTHSDHNQVATSWSSDGRYIVYNDQGPATPRDIFVIAVADRKERPLIQTPFDEHSAKFSPDGKWIAYVSNESGTAQVYLQTFPELKQKTLISREGGTLPVWSRNGRELYYRNGANMMTVSVSNGPHFSIGTASVLFRRTSQFPVFDVTPDGRFLMIDDRDSPLTAAALTVRVNWLDVLRTNAMRDARTPGLDN